MGILQSKVLGSGGPDNKALPGSPNKEEQHQEEVKKVEEENNTENEPEIKKTPEKVKPTTCEEQLPKPVEDSVVIENEETINEEITMEIEKEEENAENAENLDNIIDDSENAFIDPRSPSANIERTPVALENSSKSPVSEQNNVTPLREKPSKSGMGGGGDNLRRRALMKKTVPISVNKENQENKQPQDAENMTERPSINELPGSAPATPKPSEMSVLANEMEKLGLNSPAVTSE